MKFPSTFQRAVIIGFSIVAFIAAAAPARASAATNVYYSVGSNTSDHKTGSPTVTISGSTATFSTAQTSSSTGIGDIVTYGNTGKVFITGKTSQTVWTVSTATGGAPTATTTAPVNSIAHAFAGIEAALYFGNTTTASSTNFLNTSDLVAGNYILNVAFYNDTGLPDATGNFNVVINGWTTDATHYLRLYTPTSTTAEVNASQRHTGMFNAAVGYTLERNSSFSPVLTFNTPYVRLDGFQIKNLYTGSTYGMAIQPASVSNEYYISNNIFQGSGDNTQLLLMQLNGGASRQVHVWNNVFLSGAYGITGGIQGTFGTSTVYNNTFYDMVTGIDSTSCNTGHNVVYANNLFGSTTNPFTAGSCGAIGSGYNVTSAASLGYTVPTGPLGHDSTSATITFFDAANGNYSLASNDAAARNLGTTSPAIDIYFPFATDIVGSSRPQQTGWDVGAFEFVPTPDTTPPGLSAGTPSGRIATTTTSTTLGVTTNESATCKYDTTPGVAYASMANTFTTTGGTTHSSTISGLSSGHLYNYYVRCQDTSNNANTSDYTVTFFVNQAGTVYANSCSVADTNAAIAYVYDGDTLQIPAGTCGGYSSSGGLGINKAITVKGAGMGVTTLQIASTTSTYSAVMPLTAAATVRDLTFETSTSTTATGGTAIAPSVAGFRVTNVSYIAHTGLADVGYFVFPSVYGLIDHVDVTAANSQSGGDEVIFSRGPTNSWQTPSSMGSSSALYIEDSVFRGTGYVTDCNSNARCVVRNTTVTGDLKIDAHGAETNSPARSVRHMEIYNDSWNPQATLSAAIEIRGGTGLVFNNSVTTGGGVPSLFLHDYAWWDENMYATYGGVFKCPADYPILDQIGVGQDPKTAASEPYYLWNNYVNGAFWPLTWRDIDPTHAATCGASYTLQDVIKFNRDYYISSTSASFTGGAAGTNPGIGSGLLASRPATCTVGVAYWATDAGGHWDTASTTANQGALYKCTSTNTWSLSYVPYAHPHYLTAASTTGSTLVDVGAGARMFSTGKFYNYSTSTATSVYATVAATTTSITPDAWLDMTISLWSNTGVRHKTWTETSTTLGATTTHHMIGDLAANTAYVVKVDSVQGANISGAGCSAGVCTSDSSGKIYFDYTGGYSTHTFDVIDQSSIVAPTVTTSSASSISTTGASINGTIADTGGANATQSGFAWGTASNLSGGDTATTTLGSQTGAVSFSSSLSSLTCATTYYSRAYATNSAGTGYGSIVSFTTSACPIVSSGGGSSSSITAPSSRSSEARRNQALVGQTPSSVPSISAFINALIQAGVIPADRAEAAKTIVSSPSTSVSAPHANLQYHDKGETVRSLQAALAQKGYLQASPNGIFGPSTLKALKAFQKAQGIPATGYYGPLTRSALAK